MKKYLVLALLFASSLSYSQKNDTCDYFSVGVFGGSYISRKPVVPVNNILNSVVVEMEFRKTKDLSFIANFLYMFPSDDIKKMFEFLDENRVTPIENPTNFKCVVALAGRYYLSSKNVNPFVQLGLSQEYYYVGKFSYKELWQEYYTISGRNTGYNKYKLSILIGAGLNFNISRKLNFNLIYNIYQNIEKDDGNFLGFSVYGGLKYNIF